MEKVNGMAKSKAADSDGLSEMLGIRVAKSDIERIDALAERMPVGTRHSIARVALRLGLDAIERDPVVLIGGAPKGRR